MKILVLSDSHSSLSFMRRCIEVVNPHAVVHLGDYQQDGEAMKEEFPQIRFYIVQGNCDRYVDWTSNPTTRIEKVCGADLYMTHGHLHQVKSTLTRLIADARASGVQAALYGHTHEAYCEQLEDGLWILNPGSCGYYGGSAGLLEVEDRKIISCRSISANDLDKL